MSRKSASEITVATFAHPRYELNGVQSDGAEAVRELLQGLMQGFPDLQIDIDSMRHADDGVFIEARIMGTHDGEWSAIAPTGRRVEIPGVAIFEFDDDRFVCENVFMNIATVLTQIGALPTLQG
jgi:steroid delta-isomerase-like uncharacterized protein